MKIAVHHERGSEAVEHAKPLHARLRRKEARPLELLDAALELFVERGFAATRSEDVAARAGVSKGTLYLYFPSKEKLLKAVIRQKVVNEIAEGFEIVRAFEGSSADLLALMLRMWWERIGETPASGIVKLMICEVRNFPEIAQFYVDEVVAPSNQMMAQMIQRGVDRGEFRAVDVPRVVSALIGPLVFLAMNKHSLGACSLAHMLDPKAVIEAQIDLALHGLMARPAGSAKAAAAAASPRRKTHAKQDHGGTPTPSLAVRASACKPMPFDGLGACASKAPSHPQPSPACGRGGRALLPLPPAGEGGGRSGALEPHAASPLSGPGLQAGTRTASEGCRTQ